MTAADSVGLTHPTHTGRSTPGYSGQWLLDGPTTSRWSNGALMARGASQIRRSAPLRRSGSAGRLHEWPCSPCLA